MTSDEPEPETTFPLSRWFFALPEPLPFPDQTRLTDRIGDVSGVAGKAHDPQVTVIVHQTTSAHGRLPGVADAVFGVIDRVPGLRECPDQAGEQEHSRALTDYTVIEAVTRAESPDEPPADWSGLPQDLLPRADDFMRCLAFVTDIVRVYRLTAQHPLGLPSYPKISFPVVRFSATAKEDLVDHEGYPLSVVRPIGAWEGPIVVFPDHPHLADPASGPAIEGEVRARFDHYLGSLRVGDPLFQSRERVIEARRSLDVFGETGQAVVLGNTARETLLDEVLTLLMWEEGLGVEDAAARFEEGQSPLRRMDKELRPRLKGNWSTVSGPVGEWHSNAYRLRHRVVHGGYTPSRVQAAQALNAVRGLEHDLFDRLAASRNRYPRATLMTIAEEGLRRRSFWNGQIRRFAEQVAPREPNWALGFADYSNHVVASRA